MGVFKNLGSVSFEPENFGTNGLRRQGIAAHLHNSVFPNFCVEVVDFLMCSGIHTIKDTVHQRVTVDINWQHTRTYRAAGNGQNLSRVYFAFGNDRLRDLAKIAPPILIRAMLCPARVRDKHFMPFLGLRDDGPILINKNRFGFKSPYVNAKRVLHSFQTPLKSENDEGKDVTIATSNRVSPTRSLTSQTSRDEWEYRIGKPRSAEATPSPTNWT